MAANMGSPSDPIGINTMRMNGVLVSGPALVSILNMITIPDPNKWFRFWRVGDMIHVETKRVNDETL